MNFESSKKNCMKLIFSKNPILHLDNIIKNRWYNYHQNQLSGSWNILLTNLKKGVSTKTLKKNKSLVLKHPVYVPAVWDASVFYCVHFKLL